MNQASEIKNLLVLARRDPIEAMRVAAGLTIHDHQVQILFLCEADLGTEEAKEYLELLEFSEIVPKTILPLWETRSNVWMGWMLPAYWKRRI